MIHKLQSIFGSRIMICAAIILMSVSVNSCTKSSSSSNADTPFLGTWNGTSSCGGAATITFTGSGNTVMTNGTVGSTSSCVKAVEYTGTASGSSISFPTTVYTDNCGNSYTFSGSGTLNGSILTCTFNVSGNGISGSCTFTGTK